MTSPRINTDSLHDWLATPTGQYLLRWEQGQFDRAVADVFGFHALQLGLSEFDALAANRMPHRWLGCDRLPVGASLGRDVFLTQYEALPFSDASLDLLVLPHTLELSFDPHATLREVARVLVPEGRVVIAGFNPTSLWGVQKSCGKGPPDVGDYIGHWRLRDWLRLLNFEVQDNHFGCYRPAVRSERWLQRLAWLDSAGSRSWPIFGGVYMVSAIKRVRGMRLMGPAWKTSPARAAKAVTTATKGME
ncbi:methyltransferase domain-containing protein [Limnohabitans sp.]|uniref:class I SAM-dependent methyltransferase n=1 Tax=Limnohabitans sp. TaxID=1907725 RepID=UPI00286F2931|nr:methyltransferase domain-containing protein [Limnohabitans sp.]